MKYEFFASIDDAEGQIMSELLKQLSERYNLEIRNTQPNKDASILTTNLGKKTMKKSRLCGERILFIHGAKEHLVANGFTAVDRYLCTAAGLPYAFIDGMFYTVTDTAEGHECSFDNTEELMGAVRLLAHMHRASCDYRHPAGSIPRDDLGKLPSFYSRRLQELKKLKNVAKKGRSKFDYLFMDHIDYFCSLGQCALQMLADSTYEEVVRTSRASGVFCHHDFTHSNILFAEQHASVINFEYCCYELKVYDLANLLRRKMRKCGWDINEAESMMQAYTAIESISSDEMKILRAMLQFPQKFWRIANKYYNSKHGWSEKIFTSKMLEIITEIDQNKRFLACFH